MGGTGPKNQMDMANTYISYSLVGEMPVKVVSPPAAMTTSNEVGLTRIWKVSRLLRKGLKHSSEFN